MPMFRRTLEADGKSCRREMSGRRRSHGGSRLGGASFLPTSANTTNLAVPQFLPLRVDQPLETSTCTQLCRVVQRILRYLTKWDQHAAAERQEGEFLFLGILNTGGGESFNHLHHSVAVQFSPTRSRVAMARAIRMGWRGHHQLSGGGR